jgi:hypothetical protein
VTISTKFAPATTLLLALSLGPTVIHNYRELEIADGRSVTAIPQVLNGASSRATNRRPGWGLENLASEDWFERVHTTANGEVRLFAARSYDPKKLYHHPELAILRGIETSAAPLSHLPGRPDVPMHVLGALYSGGRKGLAVYVLHYDSEFVAEPISFQLRTAAKLLVGGRRPMTLLLATDPSGSVERPQDSQSAAILSAAVAAFEAQPAR